MTAALLPVLTLARREAVRFLRQRSRVIGALVQPLLMWALLGAGFNASFRPPGAPEGMGYAEYFYPGIITLVLLFTAIFATISVVEDRQSGFLQGVLVAPIPRWSIVLGQALGSTGLAVLQGILLLILAPIAGVSLTVGSAAAAAGMMVLIAFSVTGLGLILAWRLDSTQGFHAIMNLILLPLWLLSGAFFPAEGLPWWMAWVVRINPCTYGMSALRRCLYLHRPEFVAGLAPLGVSAGITAAFAVATFAAAVVVAGSRSGATR